MQSYINQLVLDAEEMKNVFVNLARPKSLAIAAACLGFGFFVYKTLAIYLTRRKYRHIPGSPTKGIFGFYVGNMPELFYAFRNGKIMEDLFVEWHEKYGDVFKFQFLDTIAIITSDNNAIKDALIEKNFPKIPKIVHLVGFPFGLRFMGIGLVTDPDNERWKYRRAIFNPGFHRHVLVTFVTHFNQVVDALTDKLRARADGKTMINFFNEINRVTLDAIALIAFGMHTDSINDDDSKLNNSLSKILHTVQEMFFLPLMKYDPRRFRQLREFNSHVKYIRKVGRDKILERITAFRNNEHMPNDILSAILQSYKGENLDLEAMTDDFVTFFVAGQETTANSLAFSLLEMGKNPEIARKARDEVDRVLGKRTEVTYQDVTELKYCSAIFKEALRLYPPVANIMREAPQDIKINGFDMPKGTWMNFSTYMNSRIEKYFKDPLKFMPERFMKNGDSESELASENYVYFPFSLGPRNCIGQNFAKLEGVIAIAKLLQLFDFRLDPNQSMAHEQALTLRPKDGARCFVTLRS